MMDLQVLLIVSDMEIAFPSSAPTAPVQRSYRESNRLNFRSGPALLLVVNGSTSACQRVPTDTPTKVLPRMFGRYLLL